MLRQFFAPHCSGDVALNNRAICDKIFRALPTKQQNILRDIFSEQEQPLPPLVKKCAETYNTPETIVWRIVRSASKKIALERGLIDHEGRE